MEEGEKRMGGKEVGMEGGRDGKEEGMGRRKL